MARNVVIDLDARTKNFENALDEMTAKVKSAASQMDKSFSFSGNAEKQIKNTSHAVSELHSNLKDISLIAAGNVLADGFEKALKKVTDLGKEIYATTARMQSLEMGMKSLVTSDLVKTGQVQDYTEATKKAEAETKKLMDWFKELSLKSPYELVEVMEAFKSNANMGQSVSTAKKTTEAILALGAGLGMEQAQMKRFSAALAQTGATGRITAMDLRQFANNGFGMDKMNQIFSILSEKYKIVISDNNDFNKAVAEGKITTDAFFDALNTFALENYGGAIDAMASTIAGLKSSLGDIKVSAINDLFLETSKTLSKTIAPYVEYLMQLLTGGDFSEWGKGINTWVSKLAVPFQKIGETLGNGLMTRGVTALKDFLSGKDMNVGALKTLLTQIKDVEFADKWIGKLGTIKSYIDKFLAHKDKIISAIKGIGVALATSLSISLITKFASSLTGILFNPVSWLIGAGAALGVAWSKNLFDIQGKFEHLKTYVIDLYKIFQKDGFTGVWEKLSASATKAWTNMKKNVPLFSRAETLFRFASLHGNNIFTPIFNQAKQTFDNILVYGNSLLETFRKDGVTGVINKIDADIKAQLEKTKANIKAKVEEYKATFASGGLTGLFSKIGEDFRKAFSDEIIVIRRLLNDLFGAEFTTGLTSGIQSVFKWIGTAFDNTRSVVQNIISYFNDMKKAFDEGGIKGLLSKVWTDFKAEATEALNNVKGKIQEIVPEGVLSTIQTIYDWIDRIVQAVGGIGVGIASIWVWLEGFPAVWGFISAIPKILAVIPSIISAIANPVNIIIGLLAVGFSILGQFIDFGDLIVNIINTIKKSITNVVNGIIENVVPKFKGLLETLQPFIMAVVGIVATAGTLLATAVLGLGTVLAGVINGIIKGFDNILAVVIDVIDFVLSIVRLPFDFVIDLLKIVYGAITGNQDLIENAQQHFMGRLKHIWDTFKSFWIDLWGFIKDFFSGIWETIVSVIDSVDITAGLERLFGEGVVAKVEEFKTRVLNIIDEIITGWLKMTGQLSGRTVNVKVGGEEREISGTAYEKALYENNARMAAFNTAKGDWATISNQSVYGGQRELKARSLFEEGGQAYIDWYGTFENYWKTVNEAAQMTQADAEAQYLEEWYRSAEKNIRNFYAQSLSSMTDAEGRNVYMSPTERKAAMDDYIAQNYAWAKEDPYMMSLLEDITTKLDQSVESQQQNTKAVESNTEATDTQTKKEYSASDKPESSLFYTDEQISLWMSASDALTKELQESVGTKSFNSAYIDELAKVVSNEENRNLDAIRKQIDIWMPNIGMDDSTRKSIMALLNTATDSDTLLAMLGNVVSVLESGNTELKAGLESAAQKQLDANTQIESTITDIMAKNKSSYKEALSEELPILGTFSYDFGDADLGTGELEKEMAAQNDELTNILSQLDTITKIEESGDDAETQKQIEEAKAEMLKITEELGGSKEQLEALKTQMDKAASAEDIIEMAKTYKETIISSLMPEHDAISSATDAYYQIEMDLLSFFKTDMPKVLSDMQGIDENSMLKYVNSLQGFINFADEFSLPDLQKMILDTMKTMDLPEEIMNAYSDLLTKDGVSKDLVIQYVGDLVTAITDAGLLTSKASETPATDFKAGWSTEYLNAWNDMYTDFLGGYENAIARQMKAGKTMEEAVAALGIAEENFASGGMAPSATTAAFFNGVMPKMMEFLGNKMDSFNHVTVDNFAEAQEFLLDSEAFTTLYDQAMAGTLDAEFIMTNLETTLDGLFGKEFADGLTNNLSRQLDNLPKESQLSTLQGWLFLINNLIGDFKTDNDANLKAVDTSVKNLKGGGTETPRSKGQAALDYAMLEYDNATSDEARKVALNKMQAALDAGLMGGDTWGWNAGDNRLSAIDLVNQGKGGDVYRSAMIAFNNGFSENIAQLSFEQLQQLDIQKAAEQAMLQTFGANLWSGTGTSGETGTSEGEETSGAGGLMSLLFGNPEMYQQLAEVLTPEVMTALQTLVSTELNAEPWTLFAEALSTVATSLTTMQTALTGGEEGTGLTTLLGNLKGSAEELAEYFGGDFGSSIDTLMKKLALTSEDENGEKSASGGNTLYTTWGWIYQLIKDTYKVSLLLGSYWRTGLPSAVESLKKSAGDVIGVLQEMFTAAQGVADQLYRIISYLGDLKAQKTSESLPEGSDNTPKFAAGGGTIFPYGTAIVGEHGPEIIRAGSSQLNVFANSELMGEIAHIRHAFNGLANSAEAVYYNRMGGTANSSTTDNSQHFENNFNGVMIGEKAMKEMIEDTVRETWRKEMRLAS